MCQFYIALFLVFLQPIFSKFAYLHYSSNNAHLLSASFNISSCWSIVYSVRSSSSRCTFTPVQMSPRHWWHQVRIKHHSTDSTDVRPETCLLSYHWRNHCGDMGICPVQCLEPPGRSPTKTDRFKATVVACVGFSSPSVGLKRRGLLFWSVFISQGSWRHSALVLCV